MRSSAATRRVESGLGLSQSTADAVVRLLDALVPVALARLLIRVALWLWGRPSRERLDRFWHEHLLCEEKARDGANQGLFLRTFHRRLLGSQSFEALAVQLSQPGPALVAGVEAFVRAMVLAAVRHYLLESRGGPPPLSEVHLACCVECDLACRGCYSEGSRRCGQTPSPERLGALMDQASRSGAAVIHLVGKGEPLLDERFALGLLDQARARRRLLFTLSTSGQHVTPAVIEALARTPNLLCLVSLDGLETRHDARRGPGTYARARDAIARLRAAGIPVGFTCTVTRENWDELASPDFLGELSAAGCCLGVFSRFFSVGASDLALDVPRATLDRYRQALDHAAAAASFPVIDLDELEESIGCRARAGHSVYLDGTTGRVTPCIRVPWSPASCTLAPNGAGNTLDTVLSEPFFRDYRRGECAAGCWCGSALDEEQASVRQAASVD